jgi:hypothetical protein
MPLVRMFSDSQVAGCCYVPLPSLRGCLDILHSTRGPLLPWVSTIEKIQLSHTRVLFLSPDNSPLPRPEPQSAPQPGS